MRNKHILTGFFLGIVASTLPVVVGCKYMDRAPSAPLTTVSHVDLNRYMGEWYEIARYPNSFQKGCVGSKATYTLLDDGKVSVLNECYDGSLSGKLRSAKGKAWVIDKETNAKLKVSFFWFFAGDYWIIDLGSDYEYAVIGHPKRKYLWILSRTKEMDEEVYEGILSLLRDKQYDTSKLTKTIQQ
jgi:apolipoprotein D and lipocalin family protein